jgi:hypothetical protein
MELLDGWKLAIAGGLLVLLAIVRWRQRASGKRIASRHTQFHFTAVDPSVAENHTAAWEGRPTPFDRRPAVHQAMAEPVVDFEIDVGHTQIGYVMPRLQPKGTCAPDACWPDTERFARGSQREVESADTVMLLTQEPASPARPTGWEASMSPSVTARMRAAVIGGMAGQSRRDRRS